MAYVVEVPVDSGGRLLVQASDDEVPGGLELAATRPGQIVARAQESLETALDQIRPAIGAVVHRLAAMSPDEATVEFGILLGAETGAIVAKGTAEVHFAVTLTWKRPAGQLLIDDSSAAAPDGHDLAGPSSDDGLAGPSSDGDDLAGPSSDGGSASDPNRDDTGHDGRAASDRTDPDA